MFAHYYPPEFAEYIQNGMLVSVMGGNGLHASRYPPYPVPMTHIPLMHMAGRTRAQNNAHHFPHWHASTACPGEGPPQMRKLFIGGLSHETSDDALRVYFSQWGPVVDAIVIRDPTTKQSRGFGFVTFATIASAETAMVNRPHIIAGKTVDSKRAIPREQMTPMFPSPFFECEPGPGCKLMLSGIHWDFHSVETLRIYFEKFGSLDQVEILGHPRGLGFIVYEDKECADKCLNQNRGRHYINEKKVDVRPFPKPAQLMYWRRNPIAPQSINPLYDQFTAMNLSTRATQYDEDSSCGGTTTEDDCKSSDHGSSSSAIDTDSPSNTSH